MLIKTKLLIVTLIGLLSLSGIITTIAVRDSTIALEDSQLEKLSSVEAAKHGEIKNYFSSLKGLLISLANHQGTKDAFLVFEDGFYKLQNELNLDIPVITKKIKNDFKTNYLSGVNYEVPSSEQKKEISQYLPTNINALVAQYIFIVDNDSKLGEKNNLTYNKKYNSTYMKAHEKYHETFDRFLNNFELYDIFMVDLKGNLIYTDFKEKDYATNLKSGVYSNTGIATAYKKALQLDMNQLAFDDFKPYEPSYNSAASFIATPIFINGIKKGVLIFQMPVDRINSIVSFDGHYKQAGLGESGETYLVGMDYKMRSNSRFIKDIKDSVVQKLGSTIGIWEVKTFSTKAVVEGVSSEGKGIIKDYRGVNVLSVYNTIDLFGQTKWAIVAELDEEEALLPAIALRNTVIISAVIISILVLLIIVYFINSSVIKPLNIFQNGLMGFFKYLNKESEEVPHLDDSIKHEIGQMAQVINENIAKTQKNLSEDRNLIDETIAVTDRIKKGYLDGKIAATSSYPALNELRDILNNTIYTLNENLGNIKEVLVSYTNSNYHPVVNKNNMEGVIEELIDGINILGESITDTLVINKRNGLTLGNSANTLLINVENLTNSSNEAASSLEETAAALEEITSTIISNSDNVTQMAKYAAKVTTSASDGEELANNTMVAMDEINTQVNSINEAITVIDQIAFQTNILSLNAAVEAATAGEAGKGFAVVAQEVRNLASRSADAAKEIKEIVETATVKANAGKDIASGMLNGYKGLNQDIDKTIELIKDVDAASKEQQSGIEQINDAVTQLDQQTQRNSAAALETNDIAIGTQKLSETIINEANKKEFKGKDDVEDRRNSHQDLQYGGVEKRKAESEIRSSFKKGVKGNTTAVKKEEKVIVESNTEASDTNWESF